MGNGKVARVVPSGTEKFMRAKDQLASDFNTLVSDAEELLSCTAAYSGETIAGARSKFKGTLDQFKGRVADAQSSAIAGFDRTESAVVSCWFQISGLPGRLIAIDNELSP